MAENKKRRYPSGRLKLHAMKDRLETEITERQEMLEEVTRLTRQADNTAIVNTATNYNVTPETFNMIVQALNSGALNTEMLTAAIAAEAPVMQDDEQEPGYLETDPDDMEDVADDEQ